MVRIEEIGAEALKNYFHKLECFGTISDNTTKSAIILCAINDILTGDMKDFVSEDDYRTLEQCYESLSGCECIIPFEEYLVDDYIEFGDSGQVMVRRMEEDESEHPNYRAPENSLVRIKVEQFNY